MLHIYIYIYSSIYAILSIYTCISFSLSLYIYIYIYIYICLLSIYTYVYYFHILSLPLSLSTYIYIYIYRFALFDQWAYITSLSWQMILLPTYLPTLGITFLPGCSVWELSLRLSSHTLFENPLFQNSLEDSYSTAINLGSTFSSRAFFWRKARIWAPRLYASL